MHSAHKLIAYSSGGCWPYQSPTRKIWRKRRSGVSHPPKRWSKEGMKVERTADDADDVTFGQGSIHSISVSKLA